MPQRRGLAPQPRAYLALGHQWPEGDLVADAPMVALFAKELAQRLKDKLAEDGAPTVYALANEADLSRQTVANLLNGRTWGDLPTIHRLEIALRHRLWLHADASWSPGLRRSSNGDT